MEGSLASTVGGANNPRWLAPELLDGQQATPAADVFAFGVVMWEVLTWDIPWQTEQAFVVSGRSARWIQIWRRSVCVQTWMDGWMDGGREGWRDGWMGGWRDGWVVEPG